MIFNYVTRRLRWLAGIPGAPHLFDALLLTHTALFHPGRFQAIEDVEAAALRLPHVSLRVHRFGGVGFAIFGEELAHLHGNGLFDAHLGRRDAAALVKAGRAEWHHVFGRSAWVSLQVRDGTDAVSAVEILKRAIERRSQPHSEYG